MKKSLALASVALVALAFTSCKSQESAYKKAWEKAQAQEQAAQQQQQTQPVAQQEQPTVTPVVTKPADQTTVTNVDNEPVRQDNVTLIDGAGLQQYSVVVGSYTVQTNATGMQKQLKDAGYDAQVVYSSQSNTYRVVASTYADKAKAVESRNAIRGSRFNPNSDAWLLYKK